MGTRKCFSCGLTNFQDAATCKRCGASLLAEDGFGTEPSEATEEKPKRSLRNRISWICGMTATILLIVYISLRLTSDYPGFEQRQAIERAIGVIETRGFSREGFVLKYLATFRTSDNWWNIQTGHKEAYAATNFPFEVVTLYPEFFNVATDDTERAAILLHETKHMLGSGEEGALRATWVEKEKLGWTADIYSQTKVWENTRDLTRTYAPELIVCDQSSPGGCGK